MPTKFLKIWMILIPVFSLLEGTFCIAQVEQMRAAKWYFGNNHGFDFASGEIMKLEDSNIQTVESCCTMSDRNGNLLFYTNGGGREDGTGIGYIWNSQHEVMEGGDLGETLGGGYSSFQGCLAVPRPGNSNLYYLFTVDEIETLFIKESQFPQGKGCSYFEIDVAANNGKGKVKAGKEKLLTPCFEYISGTLHANCTDYWVIIQTGYHLLEGNANVADSFYVFLVNELGIQQPIIIPMIEGLPDVRDEYGAMKISPDGTKLICGTYIYDFDKLSGNISSPRSLYSVITDPNAPLAFSPNGQLLYNFRLNTFGDTTFKFEVLQYDLGASILDSSEIFLGAIDLVLKSRGRVGTPQLASDGKIYVPSWMGKPFRKIVLTRIDNPDVRGEGASFTYDVTELSVGLDERFLRFGNFMDHIFKRREEKIYTERQFTLDINCEEKEQIVLRGPKEKNIYVWSENSQEDSMVVKDAGKYWVNYATGCDAGTDTFLLYINNRQFDVSLPEDIVFLCENDRYLLNPEPIPNITFKWQDDSFAPDFEVEQEGLYIVEARLGLCVARDSVLAIELTPPKLELGKDTIICKGKSFNLTTAYSPYNSYHWQNGMIDTSFTVTKAGNYELVVSNYCGFAKDKIFVEACPECDLYIPNVFSPNGDGVNDFFRAFPNPKCAINNYQMTLLDRWGNQLFRLRQLEETWNGQFKNQLIKEGAYLYFVSYTVNWPDGRIEQKSQIGEVTLIR